MSELEPRTSRALSRSCDQIQHTVIQVLQSPSSCIKLVQLCAVCCFEDTNNDTVVTQPYHTQWLQQC
jgi:hypothetical protein